MYKQGIFGIMTLKKGILSQPPPKEFRAQPRSASGAHLCRNHGDRGYICRWYSTEFHVSALRLLFFLLST